LKFRKTLIDAADVTLTYTSVTRQLVFTRVELSGDKKTLTISMKLRR